MLFRMFALFASLAGMLGYQGNARAELLKTHAGKSSGGAILLVHGLGGSPETTFGTDTSNRSWLRQLKFDERPLVQNVPNGVALTEYDIWTYRYLSGGTGGGATNVERLAVDNFMQALTKDPGFSRSEYSHIVIIAHSLGGLVVRQAVVALQKGNSTLLSKIRSIIFMGTPSLGAPLAQKAIEALETVFLNPSKVALDLRPSEKNVWLRNLDADWQKLIKSKPRSDRFAVYCGYELLETPIPPNAPLFKHLIVPPESASHGCDEVRSFQRDHFQLVQPIDGLDEVYLWTTTVIGKSMTCPSIAGKWRFNMLTKANVRIGDFDATINQTDCRIDGIFWDRGRVYRHAFSGVFNRDRYHVTMKRTGPFGANPQCDTIYRQGRLKPNFDATRLNMNWLETDGQCGIDEYLNPDAGNFAAGERTN